jgi:hypothetical protein
MNSQEAFSGRCPAGLSEAGRVPAGIAVLCPTGLPSGGGRGPCCGSGRGRVAGKPGQHRSDRLGLLLVKAAAGLTAQQLHLDSEPWRPWSWPSRAAALASGGLMGGWRGPKEGRGGACTAPCSPRLLAPPAESGKRRGVAPQRHRPCPEPRSGSRPTTWLARVTHAPSSLYSPGTDRHRRGGSAAVRSPATHRPFTRSAAGSSVDHPPLGGTVAAGGERRNSKRSHRGAGVLAACGSHPAPGALVARQRPPNSTASSTR